MHDSKNPRYFTSTKVFRGFPCCHRQPGHGGHCKFLHGYERSFMMWFSCEELTHEWFVADFGALKEVKQYLEDMFDHTCLINQDDPERATFEDLHEKGIIDLRLVPNVSMEATSQVVLHHVNRILSEKTNGRAWCFRVETRENDRNSAFYEVPRHYNPHLKKDADWYE